MFNLLAPASPGKDVSSQISTLQISSVTKLELMIPFCIFLKNSVFPSETCLSIVYSLSKLMCFFSHDPVFPFFFLPCNFVALVLSPLQLLFDVVAVMVLHLVRLSSDLRPNGLPNGVSVVKHDFGLIDEPRHQIDPQINDRFLLQKTYNSNNYQYAPARSRCFASRRSKTVWRLVSLTASDGVSSAVLK